MPHLRKTTYRFDPMKPRRHDTCPNVGFVPRTKATRDEFQKPLRMTREEAMEAAKNRRTYLNAAKIAADAVRAGHLRLPVKKGDL